jgi:hypothetical protein
VLGPRNRSGKSWPRGGVGLEVAGILAGRVGGMPAGSSGAFCLIVTEGIEWWRMGQRYVW